MMNFEKPLITFIIASFNSGNTLEETIKSILNQTYTNIELIIIDGLSNDNSLQIIEKYKSQVSYWVSEKDNGIADAFNKGLSKAKGKYINFQGAGDTLVSSEVIHEIFSYKQIDTDFIIGRINRVEALNNKNIIWISSINKKQFNIKTLLWKMSLYHQALFTNIKYFEKYGLFNLNLKYSMDYEHVLRSYKSNPTITTSNIIISNWRKDGIGENNELKIYQEYNHIKRMHKIAPLLILNFVHIFILCKYYFKNILNYKN